MLLLLFIHLLVFYYCNCLISMWIFWCFFESNFKSKFDLCWISFLHFLSRINFIGKFTGKCQIASCFLNYFAYFVPKEQERKGEKVRSNHNLRLVRVMALKIENSICKITWCFINWMTRNDMTAFVAFSFTKISY